MKKFLNIFKQLLKFVSIFLFLQIPGALILALYLPFNSEIKKLPFLLRWFDGADQYFGRNTKVYDKVMQGGAWQKYCWLAWRNPLNYFGYKYLGFSVSNSAQVILDSRTSNNLNLQIGDGIDKCPGTFYIEISNEGSKYFEYYKIVKYSFFGQVKCLRIRIGWKIGQDHPITTGQCQWVFVVSPFHSYDGI